MVLCHKINHFINYYIIYCLMYILQAGKSFLVSLLMLICKAHIFFAPNSSAITSLNNLTFVSLSYTNKCIFNTRIRSVTSILDEKTRYKRNNMHAHARINSSLTLPIDVCHCFPIAYFVIHVMPLLYNDWWPKFWTYIVRRDKNAEGV